MRGNCILQPLLQCKHRVKPDPSQASHLPHLPILAGKEAILPHSSPKLDDTSRWNHPIHFEKGIDATSAGDDCPVCVTTKEEVKTDELASPFRQGRVIIHHSDDKSDLPFGKSEMELSLSLCP